MTVKTREGYEGTGTGAIIPDGTWTQTFRARPLTKEQFEAALAEVGLEADKYLTPDGTWVRAVRTPR